jgi:hypothetical protein
LQSLGSNPTDQSVRSEEEVKMTKKAKNNEHVESYEKVMFRKPYTAECNDKLLYMMRVRYDLNSTETLHFEITAIATLTGRLQVRAPAE